MEFHAPHNLASDTMAYKTQSNLAFKLETTHNSPNNNYYILVLMMHKKSISYGKMSNKSKC